MKSLDALMLRVAHLRASSLHLFQNSRLQTPIGCCGVTNSVAENIAKEAESIDAALLAWSHSVPSGWRFTAKPTPAGRDAPTTNALHDAPAHEYASHAHAVVWNQYRAARLIVNSICIRALQDFVKCPAQRPRVIHRQRGCQDEIENLANDLCGGALFLFSDYDPACGSGYTEWTTKVGNSTVRSEYEILPKLAILLAWPLMVAVNTESLPASQKRWLVSRMKSVAEALGDDMLHSIIQNGDFCF